MSRRRIEQDRPRKKGKGKPVPTYESYEEAMEGGIEAEEQGERWGRYEKAERFYETAVQLYQKAATYSQTYDALYNCARVLYTLSTSHHLPPLSLHTLESSISLYSTAATLTSDPLLRLDAAYNRAVAMLELAELAEDVGAESDERVLGWRLEATGILEGVAGEQKGFLDSQAQEGGDVPVEPPIEANDDEMDTSSPSSSTGSIYEQFTPTPSTLLDTLLLLLDTYLTIWDTRTPPSLPSAAEQSVVQALLVTARGVAQLAGRVVEVEMGEINVLTILESVHAEVDPNPERSIATLTPLIPRLTSLLTPPPTPELLLELQTTLSTLHSRLATLHAPGAAQWSHLSLSTTALTTSLSLPTVLAAPLGRAGTYLSLSALSVRRWRLAREVGRETSKGVLLENAGVYAGKGLEELGWKYFTPSSGGVGRYVLPERGGWGKEFLGYSLVLSLARAYFLAEGPAQVESRRKLQELVGLIKGFNKVGGERRVGEEVVRRVLEGWEEEGGVVGTEERGFWEEFVGMIR